MVLNFGGGGLFATQNEERWKGVEGERIQQLSNGAASLGIYNNLPNSMTATGVKISISVKPDERVFITASCSAASPTGELMYFRIYRDGSPIGVSVDVLQGGGDLSSIPVSTSWIEEPGEGTFEYEVYGRSFAGTGDFYDIVINGFVLAVK